MGSLHMWGLKPLPGHSQGILLSHAMPLRAGCTSPSPVRVQLLGGTAKGLALLTVDQEYISRFRTRPGGQRQRVLWGVQAAGVGLWEGIIGESPPAKSRRVRVCVCACLPAEMLCTPCILTHKLFELVGMNTGALSSYLHNFTWNVCAGIVREPLQGWEDDRFLGLLVGILLGASGALLKPASGFLDCVAKILAGIGAGIRCVRQSHGRPRACFAAVHAVQLCLLWAVCSMMPGSIRSASDSSPSSMACGAANSDSLLLMAPGKHLLHCHCPCGVGCRDKRCYLPAAH